MDRVDQILGQHLNDDTFINRIVQLDDSELSDILDEVKDIYQECQAKISESIAKFKDTGIPASPEWFAKCKKVMNIRKKHMLMIEREIKLRHNGK